MENVVSQCLQNMFSMNVLHWQYMEELYKNAQIQTTQTKK